jgi:hypothetical protein
MRRILIAVASAAMLAAAYAPAASAQHGQGHAPPESGSTSLQGDTKAWSDNPHMHAFYDLTRQTLGKDAPPVDFEAYREKSYAIFRTFGVSMGMSAEGMVDHLKDIPAQLVDIVKDDPKVLDNYANFKVALMGPE